MRKVLIAPWGRRLLVDAKSLRMATQRLTRGEPGGSPSHSLAV
jgi:hypothetical protein